MANLGLADAVDTSEALLQTIWIPRQVIVHHEMSPLEVDALACSIRSQENLDFRIMEETFLGLAAFLSPHTTMNVHESLGTPENSAYLFFQIVERVAVFREDNNFLTR